MKGRSVHTSLMMNYILFSVILGLIGFLVYNHMYGARDAYLSETLPMVKADELIRDNWEDIPYETVHHFGGYIQILDDNLNSVFVRGEGQARASYTEKELNALFYEGGLGYYSAAPFITEEGREYRLLVAIPSGAVVKESRMVKPNEEQTRVFSGFILRGLLLFLLAFLLSLWLYSRMTARRITAPLAAISQRLGKMSGGGGRGRLHMPANRELMDIQRNFNRMADKLEQAEQMNRKLAEDRRRMLMDIAHDLKTPITTIQGYAEVLRLGIEENERQRRKYASHIYNKAIYIAALVDDLFALTKFESAELPFERKPLDFAELCRTTAADLYDSFEQKGIELDISIPERPVRLHGHEGYMRRAVANLLTNALKYNRRGGRVWVVLREQNGVHLTVGDNGPGIPKHLGRAIFDPFVRGDQARRSDGGSGLGLSIVKAAVEKHGGQVRLDTETEGTMIHISLPVTDPHGKQDEQKYGKKV